MLPRTRERSQKSIEAADFGTLVHHWKETGETDPPWAAERDIVCLEKKILASGIRREDWWPVRGRHEVTFALHLETLELQEIRAPKEEAEAWKAKFDSRKWLTGTIDYDGETGPVSQIPWIDDLKTGKWPVKTETRQLLSYSLYRWVKDGAWADGWMGKRSITWWPKYPLVGLPRRTYGPDVFSSTMVLYLDDVRWAHEHPDEVNPEPIYEGPWDPEIELSNCAFCPCREELPVTEWMTNYRYRMAPHCVPGMLKLINKEQDG